jgi:hypothetical protein
MVSVEDGLDDPVEEVNEVSSAGIVSREGSSSSTEVEAEVEVLRSDVEREEANLSGEGE